MKAVACIVAAIVCTALAGCMAATSPKQLAVPTTKQTLTVKTGLTYLRPEIKINYGLRPGEYVAEFEDQGGTYFRGPGNCAYVQKEGHTDLDVYEGGIWVPKAGSQLRPKLYYYVGSGGVDQLIVQQQVMRAPPQAAIPASVGGGVGAGIIGALASLDYGKIMFLPEPPADANIAEYIQKPE